MKKRIFGASHKRGIELTAAGCPLDYLEELPGHSGARRRSFRAEQLAGYTDSHVYTLGPLQTGYVIGLGLGTDHPSGTIISDWSFVPPWQDDVICWDYEPLQVIPKSDRGAYMDLLDSPLMAVLNDHRLLRRGYPIEGLLCGCSSQSIPEAANGLVYGRLSLTDERENTLTLRIALTIVHFASDRLKSLRPSAGQLLNRMDKVASDGR